MSQIIKKFIGDNEVGAAKIRLENDSYLKARNAADDGDVSLIKASSADQLEVGANIILGSYTLTNIKGSAVTVATAPGDGDGQSGVLELRSGDQDVIDNSGSVVIASGSATGGASNSGNISIQTGDADVNSGVVSIGSGVGGTQSGDLIFKSGDCPTTGLVEIGSGEGGTSGNLLLYTGPGSDLSGEVQIYTGESDSSNTGTISIYTGGADVQSGDIFISTGNAATSSSGHIQLTTGTAGTSRGDIRFQNGTEGSVGHVWTSTGVQGEGGWAAPAGAAIDFAKDTFTLAAGDITNQHVDLSAEAKVNSIQVLVKGSGVVLEGASHDYTVSYTGGSGGVTRITFANDLAAGGAAELVAGDVLQIQFVEA